VKKRHVIPIIIAVVMIILNIVSWMSTGFSDFYVMYIFPYISSAFSFISGIFPFSIGEIMIIALIILAFVGIPLFVILIIVRADSRKRTAGIFTSAVLFITVFIISTETLNCFIMYHCTTFSERYFNTSDHRRSDLIKLYKILIDETNDLADQIARDENGSFILTDDVNECAKDAMKKASENYPQLKGYYPDAKAVMNSYLMSQAGLMGIYFPFSLEANYNADMCPVNLPNTICHEYAHLKGVIQEDEAGFIAFIASSMSASADFRYSGYLNALEYVHNQIYQNNITEAYYLTDTISENVKHDLFSFLPESYWEENKEKEIISTETIDTISSSAADTSLKMNGVEDGIESYSRIVDLMLDYYKSIQKL